MARSIEKGEIQLKQCDCKNRAEDERLQGDKTYM
jgi:hypothetical protein